ncbi:MULTISPECIES: MASE3 domain-containing protein [Thermodesulfovibrio]|uniref:MASE3 domain-containing protein n=1 Tax=Thermodesulfovibrio yellowstonii TaxID=28262 RepID=UPI000429CA7D|nr:MASE3 domain-containing protein [Thermodesulfovibrio islandicus]
MKFLEKYEDFVLLFTTILIISLSIIYSYLLFHTLAEIYSIIIGTTIFIIYLNLRDKIDQGYVSLLGIAYLFVSIIDLIHTLAYKGMNIFQGFDANLPTQLWISARYLESLSFLCATLLINKKINVYPAIWIYSAITVANFISIFVFKSFPDCYIEGQGLTAFKIYSEYVICLILAASLIILRKNKSAFPRATLLYLQLALITTILAELSFTKYVSVYGVFNFIGHIFKITSFFFIYKALVKTALTDPFNLLWKKLKENEERLKEAYLKLNTYIEVLDLVFVVVDRNKNVIRINQKGAEKLGYTKEELIGKNWFDTVIPQEEREKMKIVFDSIISGETELVGYFENKILRKDGLERIFAWHNTVLKDTNGKIIAVVSAGEDITDKKVYDENREKLVNELQKALEDIRVLKGLIPICAWCKKIRNDEGYWMQLEKYLQEHTEAEFTHSICPECYEKIKKDIKKMNSF